MAQIVATRSYLKEIICLEANQAGTDRENAIIAEGLNDPTNLFKLSEDDSVRTLCHNFRKPSGTEPQPGWNIPNPNPLNITAQTVARSVQYIPAIFEQRFNIAAYGANTFTSVGRQVNATSLSRYSFR